MFSTMGDGGAMKPVEGTEGMSTFEKAKKVRWGVVSLEFITKVYFIQTRRVFSGSQKY
jgi:hypothetical protein